MQKMMEGIAMPIAQRPSPAERNTKKSRPTLRVLALAVAVVISVGLWTGGYALVRLIW